ncbi:hypothetical protein PILCRDRAFT_83846 [Piloderma croceum F 1598]|uniref:AMP-dependent synthetase/ligase domain-containing protein n=1 Tax=Piloderma croceum (strain F 1598) TaxID=765440 RepID=A0A0C3CQ07_PILCF|nr:hypothetical protein PILCRDRAFT_83846 [Piloderma croceum F 1598]
MASRDFSSNIETSPRTQASNSTTFRPPPQDKFLLVSEIFHHHYLNSPNHPIFKYEDSPGVVKTIYWSDWYLAIHRAGRYVRKIFGFSEEPNERPVIAMLANTENNDNFELLPPAKYGNIHDPISILHSTGTTGLPKPIIYSHINFQIYGRTPSYGERDLTGMVISAHGLAVYGVTAAQQAVMAAWSKDLGRVKYLKTIQGILTGGSPLEKLVGDALSAEGVPIYHMFGWLHRSKLLDCDVPNPKFITEEPQRHWDYFRFSTNVKTHFIPNGYGAYELILLDMGPDYLIPAVINTKIGNVNGYATRDLFVPHPTIPGYWKSHGRVDDQILHSTAQMTNAVPLESILNIDPHIQGAVIFGQGKLNAGVVIDPRLPYKFDPRDEDKLNDFRDKIWPTVKKVNEVVPHHSRISREMIIVSSPAKPFTYTAKSTASRPMVTTNYKPEIEALYASVAKTAKA